MEITLKYGSGGIPLRVEETPGFVGVLAPSEPEPVHDPLIAIAESIRRPIDSKPLADIARGRKNAVVVISDMTRPVPNKLLLPPILDALHSAGIPRQAVTLLIATGIHRPSTEKERLDLVGPEIAASYRIVDHLSKKSDDMVEVGKIAGHVPALVNRLYVEADLKVLTGFIEPHMWGGYSGGRKSILPGISSVDTLQFMHGPEMIAHPMTEYGQLEGNLFHEAGLQIMEKAGCDFIVNVTLNRKYEVTGIFSGPPRQGPSAGLCIPGAVLCAHPRRPPRLRGDHQRRPTSRLQPLPIGQGHDRCRHGGEAERRYRYRQPLHPGHRQPGI